MQTVSSLRSAVPLASAVQQAGLRRSGAVAPCSLGSTRRLASVAAPLLRSSGGRIRSGKGMTTNALFGFGAPKKDDEGLYSYSVKDIDGKNLDLAKYRGKALLIVNVASQCGFTPQYEGLTELYNKYKSKGLEILAFPCNQFGGQEPGDAGQIKSFASNRGAKFQIANKVDVNGTSEEPLYGFLKSEQGGFLTKDIKWNFTKFLCDKDGKVIKRYGTSTEPSAIDQDIAACLA